MLAFEKIHRFCYVTCILVLFHVVNSTENPYPEFIPYMDNHDTVAKHSENLDIRTLGLVQPSRWLIPDPLADNYPGWSPYNYTLGNPLRYVDPNGMWVAEYDEEGNIVMVHYEDGDTFESLYTQLGMTADVFAERFGVDIAASPAGMSFDITESVLENTDFVSSFTGSNCHGFVCTAIGALSQEDMVAGQELFNVLGDVASVSSPQTGDITVFTQTGEFGVPGQTTDLTGVPAHSAIFIVANQAGEAQHLNRLDTGLQVTVNTTSQIVGYFQAVISRGTAAGLVMPQFNQSPRYYRR